MSLDKNTVITLNDGHRIPQIGLGFWQVASEDAAGVVRHGLEAGYRLIDTAQGYENEYAIGQALRDVVVDDAAPLYITSKLRNRAHARDLALREFDESMRKLQLDQLDLLLIHWPAPAQDLYVDAWKLLVELQQAGRIRSIGVSNFNTEHLQRIIDATGVVPAVNQIEVHPRFQQRELRRFHAEHNIAVESWSPLGSGRLLDDPRIAAIAAKHGKSVAQVIIRWHLQEGLIVIPKSIKPERMRENISVYDFSLDANDMAAFAAMDSADGRTGPDPETFELMF